MMLFLRQNWPSFVFIFCLEGEKKMFLLVENIFYLILIKLLLNSKLDLIRTVKFVKQLFRIQIQKGGKVLLWNQVKSRMEACYSELVLVQPLCNAGA